MKDSKQASFAQTLGAVLWSFFGVRRKKDHENDIGKLNPVHVIIIGVGAAILFVWSLLRLVRWVVG